MKNTAVQGRSCARSSSELEEQISRLRHGDHLCMVYENRAEQTAAAALYVKYGLAAGDQCAYVADDQTVEQVSAALSEAGVDVEREQSRGALLLLTKWDAYLRSGRFDPHDQIEFFRQTTERALADGFAGFRITGEMTWALGSENGCDRVIDCEALVNGFFPNSRALALCQYNRQHFPPEIIHDVLRSHPLVVLGHQVCRNFYYEPPDLILDGSEKPQRISERVDWMMSQLKRSEQEVAERRRAEEALSKSEERFRGIVSQTTAGVAQVDLSGRFTLVNQRYCEIVGRSHDELLQLRMQDITYCDDLPKNLTLFEQAVKAGKPFVIEKRYVRPDGFVVWVSNSVSPLKDETGAPSSVLAVSVDVTQRKKAEEELRQAAVEWEQTFDAWTDHVCVLNTTGKIVRANRTMRQRFEPVHGNLIGLDYRLIYCGTAEPDPQPPCAAVLAGGPPVTSESQLPTMDGWHLVSSFPLLDSEGRQWGAVSIVRDITDRKRADERLLEETRVTETLHRIGNLLAAELDLDKLVQAVTDEATKLTEAEFGAFFQNVQNAEGGSYLLYTLSGVSKEAFAQFPMPRNTALFGPTFRGEGPIRLDDVTEDSRYGKNAPYHGMPKGHLPVRSYMAVPVTARSGEVLGGLFFGHSRVGVFRDRHESLALGIAAQAAIAIDNARLYRQAREQAEELRRADQRKDEFLAMLAHELRNPLAPIRTGLDLLAMEEGGESREAVKLMQEQVEHVVRLVDDLLDVSRIVRGKVELRREAVELATLIKRSIEAARSVVEDHQQELIASIPEQPVWLNADPVRLAQVIGNLLNNASKYTERGGRIELIAERQNGQAVVSVRDTGVGIEPELLPNVFELFTQSDRSLDRAQGGLGIGLTLVQQLVEMHGGTVSAHSEGPGHGSTFVVRLPIADAASQAGESAGRPRITESRRVLVVDDNVAAARMLSMLLTKLGDHKVETVHDGPSALARLREFRPDIVLLDIGLPGMDGYQIGRAIREISDSVALVALTGYGQDEDRRKSREAGFDVHLVKPPSVDQLESVLVHPKLMTASRQRNAANRTTVGARLSQAESEPSANGDRFLGASVSWGLPELDLPKLRRDLRNTLCVLETIGQALSHAGRNGESVQQIEEALKQEAATIKHLVGTLERAIDSRNA